MGKNTETKVIKESTKVKTSKSKTNKTSATYSYAYVFNGGVLKQNHNIVGASLDHPETTVWNEMKKYYGNDLKGAYYKSTKSVDDINAGIKFKLAKNQLNDMIYNEISYSDTKKILLDVTGLKQCSGTINVYKKEGEDNGENNTPIEKPEVSDAESESESEPEEQVTKTSKSSKAKAEPDKETKKGKDTKVSKDTKESKSSKKASVTKDESESESDSDSEPEAEVKKNVKNSKDSKATKVTKETKETKDNKSKKANSKKIKSDSSDDEEVQPKKMNNTSIELSDESDTEDEN